MNHDGNHMHFPARAKEPFQWNLNTIVGLAGLVTSLVGWCAGLFLVGSWSNDVRRDADAFRDWIVAHEADVQKITAEIEASFARVDARVSGISDRLAAEEGLVQRLSDRIAVAESRGAEVSASIRDLQANINAQSGDLKVILAWIDEQRRQAGGK